MQRNIFGYLTKFLSEISNSCTKWPHQWHSGNAQNWKTGGARFKPGRACRPSRSEFSPKLA